MTEELEEYLKTHKFKRMCPENCGTPWYEKRYEVNNIGLKLNVETFKDNPIYTIQVRTLEYEELDAPNKVGYNGAMIEKGDFNNKTLAKLKRRYGI